MLCRSRAISRRDNRSRRSRAIADGELAFLLRSPRIVQLFPIPTPVGPINPSQFHIGGTVTMKTKNLAERNLWQQNCFIAVRCLLLGKAHGAVPPHLPMGH